MHVRPETPPSERNVYAFGATSLLNDTASEMAYWVLPAFLVSIGAGPATLGVIEGVAESVASFAKLLSGYFADRVPRRKPVVVAGYAVANAVKPLLALANAWWQVLLIRFADRLAKGVRGAPRDVLVAASVPAEKVGSAFGLLQAMDSAGAIAGPLLALALIGHFGMRGIFWAAAVPGLASVLVVSLWVKECGVGQPCSETPTARLEANQHRDNPFPRAAASSNARPRLSARYYYVLFAVALFSVGNSSDMFLVLRAQETGIAARYTPLLGLVFNITYTAFSWPAGRISDRVSKYALVAAGYAVFAAVYAAFAFAPSHAVLWSMMALYGLYYALTAPVLKALVVDNAPEEARGRAFGVFYFVTSIAALAASVLAGELWKHFGAKVPLLLSSVLAIVAAALVMVAERARVGSAGPPPAAIRG